MKVKAVWNGAVIAESDQTLLVEGNHYFPAASLISEYFEPSDHKSSCFWKGTAFYYDVVVKGERNPDAAWYYPEPSRAAEKIKDHVAFWKGIEVKTDVGD